MKTLLSRLQLLERTVILSQRKNVTIVTLTTGDPRAWANFHEYPSFDAAMQATPGNHSTISVTDIDTAQFVMKMLSSKPQKEEVETLKMR